MKHQNPGSPAASLSQIWPGEAQRLGAHWDGVGVNFALYTEHATAVDLCLFTRPDDPFPADQIQLPEFSNHVWHGYVPGLAPGQAYGFRVYGPYRPEQGLRFNPAKLLLDPYARAIHGHIDYLQPVYGYAIGPDGHPHDYRRSTRDDSPAVPRSIVIDPAFDWGNDAPPRIPWSETVIYETHVKGLTKCFPDLDPAWQGTYLGLTHPPVLAYLRDLGVTAVELLPVHAWLNERAVVERGLTNYWGYNSIGFFAPDARYAVGGSLGAQVTEFKTMVKAMHAAGLEVILDVVYNHTAEGNHLGPTIAFRGIDNPMYYRLVPDQLRLYTDLTGTGNTLNVHHSAVMRMVMDSLRYWAEELHVDGFRFDLAPALGRGVIAFDREQPFFHAVQQDPVLAKVKLIAEPWDVGEGGYQVGHFPQGWTEWNDKFRDTVRQFWRGSEVNIADLGFRLTGSSDLFNLHGRQPSASVNFITAHDGFTLSDLVSYDHKHNLTNGEQNKDGTDNNRSSNNGVEGPTTNAAILAQRQQQRRNMLATLLFSQGTPMLLGGDEFGRTQQGNNNAYCQDNAISWYDWSLAPWQEELLEFTRLLLRIRREQPVLRRRRFLHGSHLRAIGARDIAWLKPDGSEMLTADWHTPAHAALGLVLHGNAIGEMNPQGAAIVGDTLALLLNAANHAVTFDPDRHADHAPASWQTLIDTAAPPDNGDHVYLPGSPITVPARALLLLREMPPP